MPSFKCSCFVSLIASIIGYDYHPNSSVKPATAQTNAVVRKTDENRPLIAPPNGLCSPLVSGAAVVNFGEVVNFDEVVDFQDAPDEPYLSSADIKRIHEWLNKVAGGGEPQQICDDAVPSSEIQQVDAGAYDPDSDIETQSFGGRKFNPEKRLPLRPIHGSSMAAAVRQRNGERNYIAIEGGALRVSPYGNQKQPVG